MTNAHSPLADVRILAVSQFGAGPFSTTLLADLGAEVIKIEDPAAGGDVARYVPPTEIEGDSLYFQSLNRGKKSLALNLRTPQGRDALRDLAAVSDAVFNNLRGDLPPKLGLTYETFKDVNPRIVCCSLSGFGVTGPRAAEPGYDYLIQGLAGYMSITGEPGAPPGKCGVSVIDFAAGFAAALGLVVGLFDARRTGIGRDVDVGLLDTAVSMLSYLAAWTLNSEWQPERTAGSAHQTLVPSQNFATSDGWIVVFCAKERFFTNLVEAMGLDELAHDPDYATFADRFANRSRLLPLLAARFATKTTDEWLSLLSGRVPCAPVNTIEQALDDVQVRARQMLLEVDHPQFGHIRETASPIRTPGVIEMPSPAPALGEHTDQVLRDIAGYDTGRIAALRASGAIR